MRHHLVLGNIDVEAIAAGPEMAQRALPAAGSVLDRHAQRVVSSLATLGPRLDT
jgi:hypothetical protein